MKIITLEDVPVLYCNHPKCYKPVEVIIMATEHCCIGYCKQHALEFAALLEGIFIEDEPPSTPHTQEPEQKG